MDALGPIWQARRWPRGWRVHHLEQIDSTNSLLLDVARDPGVASRTVLVADHQTAGRGRLDRRWEAPAGVNLLVSLYLEAEVDPESVAPTMLLQRVGLAVARAVRRWARADVGLKWPNDVLLAGGKVAGVLAQRAPGVDGVVVGVGLNVGWAPAGASRLLEHLAVGHSPPEPADLLVALLEEHDALPHDSSVAYRAELSTLGQEVRVELPSGGVLLGRAVDVDDDGRLVVLDDCAVTHRLDVGDVVHVRPAADAVLPGDTV